MTPMPSAAADLPSRSPAERVEITMVALADDGRLAGTAPLVAVARPDLATAVRMDDDGGLRAAQTGTNEGADE